MPASTTGNEDGGPCGIARFAKSSFAEIAYNARTSGKNLIFDAAVLLACFLFFEANDLLVKPYLVAGLHDGIVAYFLQCHANDLVGGIAFLAYTNGLLDLVRPDVRFRRLATTVGFIFLCGLFWELIAPLFVPGSTGDPLDVLAYVTGALLYWTMDKVKGNG